MLVVSSQLERRKRHRLIAERYARGDPIAEIAADEGVDRKTVRNVARRAGLPLRLPRQTTRNKRILQRYRDGEPVVKIASGVGVEPSYVSDLAKRAGVPPRSGWQRRYPIADNAFEVPDDVGWWLVGLIAADGCVQTQRNLVSLSQREEDADVLHAFLEYVGASNRPLTELRWRRRPKSAQSRGRYFEARVHSRRICAALGRYGVVPRKSRTLVFSAEAARQPAVWLGLFDGDGSAGIRRNSGTPRIDFYGTRRVMEQCSSFWASLIDLHTGRAPMVASHAGGLSKVSVYGANAAKAAKVLLRASPISLKRKRHVLEEIAAYVPRRTRFGEPEAPDRYRKRKKEAGWQRQT